MWLLSFFTLRLVMWFKRRYKPYWLQNPTSRGNYSIYVNGWHYKNLNFFHLFHHDKKINNISIKREIAVVFGGIYEINHNLKKSRNQQHNKIKLRDLSRAKLASTRTHTRSWTFLCAVCWCQLSWRKTSQFDFVLYIGFLIKKHIFFNMAIASLRV